MQPKNIVELAVPKAGKKAVRGTGYRISTTRILTSGHVLGTHDRAAVSLTGVDKPVSARKVWSKQEGDLDVAILELKSSSKDLPPAGVCFFAPRPVEQPRRWHSRGFAEVTAGRAQRHRSVGLTGRLLPATADESAIEIQVEGVVPEDVTRPDGEQISGWAGISGAPVFVGSTLHGVVRRTESQLPDRLMATSIVALRKDPEFRKWAGLEARRRRERSRVQREVARRLNGNVLGRLAARLPQLKGLDSTKAARELTASAAFESVAVALDWVHAELIAERGPDESIRNLEGIAAWVAPQVYLAEVDLDGTGENDRALRLDLAVAFPSLAELVLAGIECAPFDFHPTEKRRALPKPKLQLSLPAEGGIGAEGFDGMLTGLAAELEFDKPTWDRYAQDQESRIDYFNQEILRDATSPGGRRPYVAVDEDVRRNEADLLGLIEQHLEELHVIDLVGDGKPRELRAFQAIRDLLFRANERRKTV